MARLAEMEQQKRGIPVWVWFLALIPVAVMFFGVTSALAIYGVRKYMVNAKEAQARSALIEWGDGLARCGEKEGRLPPSTAPVPASAAAVSGKKYQSAPSEWNEQAHTCAAFSMAAGPQYFQYRWERRAESAGTAHAVADFDGDGAVESVFQLEVTCDTGKCERGSPLKLGEAPGARSGMDPASAATASPVSSGKLPSSGSKAADIAVLALAGLCVVANLIAQVWLVVLAFRQSVLWGLASLFVPCAQLVFVVQFWQRAKRPFLLALGSLGAFVVTAVLASQLWADASKAGESAGAVANVEPPPEGGLGIKLAPPPPHVPVPELTGAAVDLSTVMGKARKLANQWDADAALIGIEATLKAGLIQTQDGASAKLTFGPSTFATAQPKTGLFIVTYDEAGLKGAPAKGRPTKALPEPMCPPESVYVRIADGAQPTVRLRYDFDSAQRPAWIALVEGQAATPARQFEPQRCDVMGGLVAPRDRP